MADVKVPIVCLKTIFSLAARERCMTNLKKHPAPRYGKEPTKTTAVLVPICKVADVPSLLYTVRFSQHRSNGVSFPGGKTSVDNDVVQTALNETFEEIGLLQKKVEVWGKGVTVPGQNKVLVTPVIGSIENFKLSDLKINPKVVSEVFTIPIDMLCDTKNQFYTQFSNGFVMPVYVMENYKIWGVTAYITHDFLSSILTKEYYKNDFMKKKIGRKIDMDCLDPIKTG